MYTWKSGASEEGAGYAVLSCCNTHTNALCKFGTLITPLVSILRLDPAWLNHAYCASHANRKEID